MTAVFFKMPCANPTNHSSKKLLSFIVSKNIYVFFTFYVRSHTRQRNTYYFSCLYTTFYTLYLKSVLCYLIKCIYRQGTIFLNFQFSGLQQSAISRTSRYRGSLECLHWLLEASYSTLFSPGKSTRMSSNWPACFARNSTEAFYNLQGNPSLGPVEIL